MFDLGDNQITLLQSKILNAETEVGTVSLKEMNMLFYFILQSAEPNDLFNFKTFDKNEISRFYSA